MEHACLPVGCRCTRAQSRGLRSRTIVLSPSTASSGAVDHRDLVVRERRRCSCRDRCAPGSTVWLSSCSGMPLARTARALEVAGLDLERIEAAVTVGIDPLPDGIALGSRLDFGPASAARRCGCGASVRCARSGMYVVSGLTMISIGAESVHDPRHAGGTARAPGRCRVRRPPDPCEAFFEFCLIFRRQRRFPIGAASKRSGPMR